MKDQIMDKKEQEAANAVLCVAQGIASQNQPITIEAVRDQFSWMGVEEPDTEAVFAALCAAGYFLKQGDVYVFTKHGRDTAEELRKEKVKDDFTALIGRYTKSPTYLDWCQKLCGHSLYLFNMMDGGQLDFLFETLGAGRADTVLDIGCGAGNILAEIVQRTGCRGIGFDQLRLTGRTFTYVEGDLDHFPAYKLTGDIVLAVDSLYFCTCLDALLQYVKSMEPRGFYFYYSQYLMDKNSDAAMLVGDRTRLGEALGRNGMDYKTIDYSANEYALYERGLKFLDEYKEAFAREGNEDLYEKKRNEFKTGLQLYEKGLAKRYLYYKI